MGCTDCGRKGGCDSRKHGMFAAVDEALARLYPTRRWGERDETAALGAESRRGRGSRWPRRSRRASGHWRCFVPAIRTNGATTSTCCASVGRPPSIIEIREGLAAEPDQDLLEQQEQQEQIDERYLRVALSGLACFAGVQEVAMTLRRQGDDLVITERARGGVFDPVLLPRFQALVAVLAEHDIRHLDFGEIVEPPAGFDPADYADRYGAEPVIANYLFYPQPPTTISTVVLPVRVSSSA